MAAAGSAQERGVIGTRRYLQEVARRGVLIQTLVTHPSVREALRQERRSKSREGQLQLTSRYKREYGVPPERMRPAGRMMTAVALRAGRLLANNKIDLDTAEKLAIPIIEAGNKRIVSAGAAKNNSAAPAQALDRRIKQFAHHVATNRRVQFAAMDQKSGFFRNGRKQGESGDRLARLSLRADFSNRA